MSGIVLDAYAYAKMLLNLRFKALYRPVDAFYRGL